MKFRDVSLLDAPFLYDMLKQRTPEMSISFKMPTWEEHLEFIASKPYSNWYIINDNEGTIYLTNKDEIGIFINNGHKRKGLATEAINKLMKMFPYLSFYANINPDNKRSESFFKSIGFNKIQHTWKL